MAEGGFFDHPDALRKLALVVEGKTFWVSRESLGLYSPVFKAMLYGEFAEAKKDTIELPDKKAEDIEELLRCLLPNPCLKKVNEQNVDLLLSLADEYQIDDIRSRAEDFLLRQLTICGNGDEKLLNILRVAAKFRLKELLVPSIKRCAAEFTFDKLKLLIPEFPLGVVAALLYACAVPPNGKCHFVSYEDSSVSCNYCGRVNASFIKCTVCARGCCGICFANRKLVDVPCRAPLDVENQVRCLLDRV